MAGPGNLSKSKLVAYRQCPKRLWLEVHRPELRVDSPATQAVFRTGHEVGEVAQRLYDPGGTGEVVDFKAEGLAAALDRSRELLQGDGPVFEAGFAAGGALAFADVMLRAGGPDRPGWRMVEVKASTSVKRYQEDDVAIQSHVARAAGVDLRGVAIAHIDSSWTYPGDGDYRGLLVERDLTDTAFPRAAEVGLWIDVAQAVAAAPEAPAIAVGPQCENPFRCGFLEHCTAGRPVAEFPLEWLPGRRSPALEAYVAEHAVDDLRDLPDRLLTERQRRVRDVSASGVPYFDAEGAARDLAPYPLPAWFLDFETIQFGVPRWAGTRPFQMLPFQFSVHRLEPDGTLAHAGFLDLSGEDPSERFARRLVELCGEPLPVFVYNAAFEGARLAELAQRFTGLQEPLLDLKRRLVDLYPIALRRFYHPQQRGSWSIKYLLPVVAPHLDYGALPGVHDGTQAMEAYLEAVDRSTPAARKAEIEHALVRYCELDTLAMVEIWRVFNDGGTGADIA